MIQEERFRSDSKILRELAEDAYDTCVSAIDALHALLREHDYHSDHEDAAVAEASSASDHECGAAHPVPEALGSEATQDYFKRMGYPDGWTAAAPVTEPAHAPEVAPEVNAYYRRMGYTDSWLQNQQPIWAAYRVSPEAGRQAELQHGSWATLGACAGKKRVMIYKGHAFEPPSDRHYAVPGPLKYLGKYNRAAKKVDRIEPGEEGPIVPQTAEDYPWWQPRVART